MRFTPIVVALGATSTAMAAQFSNTTTPTSPPGETGPDAGLPRNIGDFDFYGCVSSSAGFPTFKKVASSGDMSLDLCAASCPGKFFGVFSSDCYCGDELAPDSTTKVENAKCNTPCPGDDAQSCGGMAAVARRQAVPLSVVLSVYQRARGGSGTTDAPGSTITSTVTSTHVGTITSCPPEVHDCPVGSKTTSVITLTTEVCPVDTWYEKKIVCYGDYCTCDYPCYGDDCIRHRVVCSGENCHAEVCDNSEEWNRLVICTGDNCQYSQCQGEDCRKKVVCYNGKCTYENCYGDECNKKLVCEGGNCHHESCYGEDCHTHVVCEGDECKPQPPCNGDCPVPPPAQPNGPSTPQENPNPKPTAPTYSPPGAEQPPPCNGNCPVAPTANPPAANPPAVATTPANPPAVVIGASDRMVPALGFSLLGALAGIAIFL